MKKIKNLFKSFTLVELIIVIAIVAILSVAAFLVVTKWIGKSRDARRLSDVGIMVRSVTIYKTETGDVPTPSGEISEGTIVTPTREAVFSYVGTFGSETVSKLDSLQKVPTDPMVEGLEYIYGVSANKKEFEVGVTLEGDEESAYLNKVFASRERVKVDGNYSPRGVVLSGGILKIIPSLLFLSQEGINNPNLGEGEAHFIVDGGFNKAYSIYGESLTGDSHSDSLARAVGNVNASFEGVDLKNESLSGIILGIVNNSGSENEMKNLLKSAITYVNDNSEDVGGVLSGINSINQIENDIEEVVSDYEFEEPEVNEKIEDKEIPTIDSVTVSELSCETIVFTINGASDNVSLASRPYSFDGGNTRQGSRSIEINSESHTISSGEIKVKDSSGNIYVHNVELSGTSSLCPLGTKEGYWTNGVITTYHWGNSDGSRARDSSRSLSTAINRCRNLSLGGRSDWYLPSLDELRMLSRDLQHESGEQYWTSTIRNQGRRVWGYFGVSGSSGGTFNTGESKYFRCIRAADQ